MVTHVPPQMLLQLLVQLDNMQWLEMVSVVIALQVIPAQTPVKVHQDAHLANTQMLMEHVYYVRRVTIAKH